MIPEATNLTDGTVWLVAGYTTETDAEILSAKILGVLQKTNFSILGESEHHFSPQGFTKVFLLGESHFAIHTWPERKISWFELASCSEEKFSAFLTELQAISLPELRIVNQIICRP